MPGKPYPPNLLSQAISVLDAWRQIDDQIMFGSLSASTLAEDLNRAREIERQLIGLANQLIDLRNQRDAVHQSIWDTIKRVRAGVKGHYGDDSSEYELVGGTRRSERKTPRRRTPAAA